MDRKILIRRQIMAIALLGMTTSAQAQTVSPQAFLEAIYRPYLAKGYTGAGYPRTDLYFAPPLAKAIDQDMANAKRKGEPPILNGDPFIDAQDWEIANLKIYVSMPSQATAVGAVAFTNFGKPVQLTVDLVQTTQGWRIADIQAASGSLRGLYKLR